MKLLTTEFTKKGIEYRMIEKSENGFIYECTDIKTKSVYYEIFRRKIEKARNRNGDNKIFNELSIDYERYPTDESFGKWAYTTRIKAKAYEIYQKL